MSSSNAERVRAYRQRSQILAKMRGEIRQAQDLFHSNYVRDMVPSRDIAAMLDSWAEIVGVTEG